MVTRLSVLATYTIGPGRRNPGRNLLNANVSCSNTFRVPSRD